jgi:hypothetical protein
MRKSYHKHFQFRNGEIFMNDTFSVSFNSPQCGWMSIGFESADAEFHTTTAHAPHNRALPELLNILTALLDPNSSPKEFLLEWNRDPEEFDFYFVRDGEQAGLQIFQYPTADRQASEREKVFEFTGEARQICEAFYATFAQMEKEIHVDEFESNWRQPFPHPEFEAFKSVLQNS